MTTDFKIPEPVILTPPKLEPGMPFSECRKMIRDFVLNQSRVWSPDPILEISFPKSYRAMTCWPSRVLIPVEDSRDVVVSWDDDLFATVHPGVPA